MKAHKLKPGQIVESPDWNDGQPVRIQAAHIAKEGVGVRYQDLPGHARAQQVTVKPGARVTHRCGGVR